MTVLRLLQMTTAVSALARIACVLTIAVLLHVVRDKWFAFDPVHAEQLLYVRSPEALDRMALEFDALAADRLLDPRDTTLRR